MARSDVIWKKNANHILWSESCWKIYGWLYCAVFVFGIATSIISRCFLGWQRKRNNVTLPVIYINIYVRKIRNFRAQNELRSTLHSITMHFWSRIKIYRHFLIKSQNNLKIARDISLIKNYSVISKGKELLCCWINELKIVLNKMAKIHGNFSSKYIFHLIWSHLLFNENSILCESLSFNKNFSILNISLNIKLNIINLIKYNSNYKIQFKFTFTPI